MYKKVKNNKWQPYAEKDPNTGKILEGSTAEMLKRKPITW